MSTLSQALNSPTRSTSKNSFSTSPSNWSHASDDATVSTTSSIDQGDIGRDFNTHKYIMSLSRRAKRKENEVMHYVKSLNEISAIRLDEREKKLSERNDIDQLRLLKGSRNVVACEKYIIEVDSKIEDQTQKRATRQFCEHQINNQLPHWIRRLNEVIVVARNCGHSNKLRWRSKSIALLQKAITDCEEDEFAVNCRLKLQRLVLDINVNTANELIRIILNLKNEYIESRTDEKSSLGKLSSLLQAMNDGIQSDAVVPHMKASWSADLQDADVACKELSIPGIGTQSNKCIIFEANHTRKPNLQKLPINPNLGDIHPDCRNLDQTKIIIQLRKLATSGLFEEAWKLFHKHFEAPPINTNNNTRHKTTPGLPTVIHGSNKIPVSLDIFKILMQAFKNTSNVNFEQSTMVLAAITSYGLKPDISIYNTLMKACIPASRWRRALLLMQELQQTTKHHKGLTPNIATFEILADCCRHSLDDSSVIFDTLRLAGLPRKFAYRVAACNAGNRVSMQVALEAMYDIQGEGEDLAMQVGLDAYGDYIDTLSDKFGTVIDISALTQTSLSSSSSQSTKSKPRVKSKPLSPGYTETETGAEEMSGLEEARRWDGFEAKMRRTLLKSSPSRFQIPGSRDMPFNTKLSRILPAQAAQHKSAEGDDDTSSSSNSSWVSGGSPHF